jgi:hypothetical protein
MKLNVLVKGRICSSPRCQRLKNSDTELDFRRLQDHISEVAQVTALGCNVMPKPSVVSNPRGDSTKRKKKDNNKILSF